jgi:Rod binding domain-containing protein
MNVAPIQTTSIAPSGPFNPAAIRNAAPEVQRAAVAAQFEAILVRQLLGNTVNSMLGSSQGGTAGAVYGDLLADSLSQQLSAGRGLGLGRFLETQLSPRGGKINPPASESSPSASAEIQPERT